MIHSHKCWKCYVLKCQICTIYHLPSNHHHHHPFLMHPKIPPKNTNCIQQHKQALIQFMVWYAFKWYGNRWFKSKIIQNHKLKTEHWMLMAFYRNKHMNCNTHRLVSQFQYTFLFPWFRFPISLIVLDCYWCRWCCRCRFHCRCCFCCCWIVTTLSRRFCLLSVSVVSVWLIILTGTAIEFGKRKEPGVHCIL